MNILDVINHPAVPYVTAAIAIGVTTLAVASKYCFSKRNPDVKTINPDDETIQRLAGEIVGQKITIGDANAYDFVATHGQYVNEYNTKSGTLAGLAAAMKGAAKGQKYGDSPEEIIQLGNDLLKKKSGQCDHMAAAVIAKIVEHIRQGGAWSSDVELVGNGGHAFCIMNRQGQLKDPKSWGNKEKKPNVIDTWLGKLGVHPKYADRLSSGTNGVISSRREILQHARFFGADRFKVTRLFTAQELIKLASVVEK